MAVVLLHYCKLCTDQQTADVAASLTATLWCLIGAGKL